MKKRITLTRTEKGWMATFHGDADIKELFGTETIPTSYTANAPALTVLNAIRTLNPEYLVIAALEAYLAAGRGK